MEGKDLFHLQRMGLGEQLVFFLKKSDIVLV